MTEYTVEFVGTGETITCSDKETILKRCIEEGIAQEYSCRVGMCLACSAEIVEGDVEQTVAVRRGLTEEEAEDYALTCMARPLSDLKLERGKYPPSIENDMQAGGGGEAAADD
ncbi:(2Fe-2S)-binding protein [Halobacteriales archaeon QS_4_70_19]|nr:MAG: (2Fe-2S)-binding protein [Halobacteriales archaeon QS_4_70_19]